MALLEDYANRRIRRERVFRDHDDDWLISRFRVPRAVLLDLCAELGPVLERATRWNHAILTTLGLMATGCFQWELADREVFYINIYIILNVLTKTFFGYNIILLNLIL